MSYRRVVMRNGLGGTYDRTPHGAIKGDLRRLERDQRDAVHLAAYARRAGITTEQARTVLDAFFDEEFVARDIPQDEYEALRAAGRDDTPTGGRPMDETIAEIRRRIAAKRAELAPGDADRIPKGERGRRDPLAAGERARREATAFGLGLALTIIDETAR